MSRLVVVSNRVSLPGRAKSSQGGLAIAMLTALERSGGLWFGWDGNVHEGRMQADPEIQEHGRVTFATLGLSSRDYQDYYAGYANRMLWPLFHYRMNFIHSRKLYLEAYWRVNRLFVRKLLPLLREDDLIWVHDYHFIPMGEELRKAGVTCPIGFFLHTPFPAWDAFRALPGHQAMLHALCAYDLIGFQTRIERNNFLDCIRHADMGKVEGNQVRGHDGGVSHVEVLPIGIDVDQVAGAARQGRASPEGVRLHKSLLDRHLIIGVDRLDYSKGLPERFQAYEGLLERYPGRRREVVFLQVAPPSRSDVPEYVEIRNQLEQASGHINGRFADYDWVPLRYLNRGFDRQTVLGFLSIGQVGLVTPLRDGMNLVAKEFVASQEPEDPGMLVLSTLAGAAQELDAAVLVNPYDIGEVSEGLQRALAMTQGERRERWQQMIELLRRNDIHRWRQRFLDLLQSHGANASRLGAV